MLERADTVAEDRVEREVERLERASARLSEELQDRLGEGAADFRKALMAHLETNATELRAETARSIAELAETSFAATSTGVSTSDGERIEREVELRLNERLDQVTGCCASASSVASRRHRTGSPRESRSG